MKAGIKHIIFDLGNVLLDLDFERANRSFEALIGKDFTRLATSEETKNAFLQLELGHYSEESFINALQRQASVAPDGRKIIDAWNSLLVDVPAKRLKMLEQLKTKGFDLYLLSNTNSIHIQWLKRHLKKVHNVEQFDQQFFTKSYYSHFLKMRKPDPEIYKFVLNDALINRAETLFVDDNEENILSAQQVGINTLHHNSGRDITEIMQSFL
jgi:putative hydrolase of the HAD superfamily